MIRWMGRRLALFLGSLVVVAGVVFWTTSVLPGDPATVILGTSASAESLAQLRSELGLDRSVWRQFGSWITDALRADFGQSYLTGLGVGELIRGRLTVSLPLAGFSMLLSMLIAAPLGIWAATRHGKPPDWFVSLFSQIGLAIPAFWAGLLLVSWLAVGWGWFPAGGFPGWSEPWSAFRALVLPTFSLGLIQAAILIRYLRAAVLEVANSDYIRTARAKGLSRWTALRKHGLRNAALPVVTVFGLQFGALLAGTVVIENVFVLPGLGNLLLQSILRRDLPLIAGVGLIITALILTVNLLMDLLYPWLDPRVSRS